MANDVTSDANNQTICYRAQISSNREQPDGLQSVTLPAGMPADAMIQTAARSFVRHMIQPVLGRLHRLSRER